MFSAAVEDLLKTYKKDLIGRQMLSRRIADSNIDLVTALAVLSRVNSLIASQGSKESETEINIARLLVSQAKSRISHNLHSISKNDDKIVVSVAEAMLSRGNYSWDIL
jgi:hypothetical protein